jgi:hypothetical protein
MNQLQRNFSEKSVCIAAPGFLNSPALSCGANPASISYHTPRKDEKRRNIFLSGAPTDRVSRPFEQEQALYCSASTC